MKRTALVAMLVFSLLPGPGLPACRAGQTNEESLIKILQSPAASPRAKGEACAQLKLMGTARSVQALAPLLLDEQLSHSARYALESMPDPAAGKALLRALTRTSGLMQEGIINSLAVRGEPAAVPQLAILLSKPDEGAAIAAAGAMGRIGGRKALASLQTAALKSTNSLHYAVVDGILMCANRMLDAGKPAAALKAFESLYSCEKADRIRLAAFRGMILASGTKGIALMTNAIAGNDRMIQSAALRLASEMNGAEASSALTGLLPQVPPPIQIALIECLARRGDFAALPTIAKLADSPDSSVRIASITAMEVLGDDSVVPLLAEKAASSTGAERKAARQSLLELNRGPVTRQLLAALKTAAPEVEPELILALGGRGDQSAVPTLLNLANSGNAAESATALQALGMLADATQIPRLVRLVADARTDESRSAAADALAAIYDRVQSPDRPVEVDALVKTVETGEVDARLALLPVCSELTQEPVRDALRAAAVDKDARVRDAAIHALCDTRDGELLPDLLKLACDKDGTSSRPLAIRGCVRLATQEENVKLSNEKKLQILTDILNAPLDTPEKRVVLSGLGAVADEGSLALATKLLADPAVQEEAEQAVIQLAGTLASGHPSEVRMALNKVLDLPVKPATRTAAQAALKKIK